MDGPHATGWPAPGGPGAMRPADSGGFALVTVVLLMIGLGVLATGLAFAAAQQASLAASTYDVVRARQAAEAALGMTIARWQAPVRSLDPVGRAVRLLPQTALAPGVTMAAYAERLGSELFLIRGIGRAGSPMEPPVEHQAVRLVRSLDLDAVGRAFDAALVARSVSIGDGARVRGDGADAPARDSAAAALCARWPVDGAAVRAPADSVRLVDGAVSGAPALTPDGDPTVLLRFIGSLPREEFVRDARRIEAPVVTPAPPPLQPPCDTAGATAWGAPTGPCATYAPLVHAPGDLLIEGGYAQGILLVDGDLVLDGGVRFRGVILALGTVTIRDAVVEGSVVAMRSRMEGGSASLDRCAVADAFATVVVTRRARIPPRSRIPAFD